MGNAIVPFANVMRTDNRIKNGYSKTLIKHNTVNINNFSGVGRFTLVKLDKRSCIIYFVATIINSINEPGVDRFDYGLSAEVIRDAAGLETLTPYAGGVVSYSGTNSDRLTGYGGVCQISQSGKFWEFARIYTDEGAIGGWGYDEIVSGVHLEGAVMGEYTIMQEDIM